MMRSASQTLIEAMEDFGKSEPKECMIVYTNDAGELCWSSSTDSIVTRIGLLEACLFYMKNGMAERNRQ